MLEHKTKMMGEVSSILLATDGTDFSEGAIQEALFFASSCNAILKILHVVKLDMDQEISTHAQASIDTMKVSPHLERVKEMANSLDINCEVIIKESPSPDKCIVDSAADLKCDVIIMGRRGKTGLAKLFVGSVTAKVIGHAPPKVLVVPKDFIISGNSILLALDGSPHSESAAEEAISMCSQCPAIKKVIALSVADSQENLTNSQDLINNFKEKLLSKKNNIEVLEVAEVGNPYKIIIEKAEETKVDLVVMGGYGKSGVGKLLMGSVTEKVISLAQCGILVVNLQED